MNDSAEVWSENLQDELSFWRAALGANDDGGRRLRDRIEPRTIDRWVQAEISSDVDPVRVLDVGAGPLTTMGSTWPGRDLEVVAVDPLADEYSALLDELGIVPVVRTVRGRGETLSAQFGREVFDFVVATNALDHCADPAVVIGEMIAVAKPGAVVFMNHFIDVADHEQHAGLHQWNLRPDDGDMVIEGYGRRSLLSEIAGDSSIQVIDRGEDFVARVVKTSVG